LAVLLSGRFVFLDVWGEALKVHLLILHLDLEVLEVAPFGEDFHCLDVFNGSKLLSIVLVTTQRIKINLLSKTLILLLDNFKNSNDLLTIEHFVVVHTSNRVEDSPHDFGIIHSSQVVSDVKAEDNFV